MASLSIIYEDPQFLVLDKPSGLVVNRSQTAREETLQDQVEKYLKDIFLSTRNELQSTEFFSRTGIVHRLDRETSGLLLVAKTPLAFTNLQAQFKERKVKKEYLALAHGHLERDRGEIIGALGRIPKKGKFGVLESGKASATGFGVFERLVIKEEVLENLVAPFGKKLKKFFLREARDYSYLYLQPQTGRTHQIRVHLKSIHHPVVGDPLYGGRRFFKFDPKFCPRLFLHASKIEFFHPQNQKKLAFVLPLPCDLQKVLDWLK